MNAKSVGSGLAGTRPRQASGLAIDDTRAGFWDAIEVSHRYDSERTLRQALTSLTGAVGIALLLPFAILLVGLPIVLAVRGLLELLAWLFATIG